MCVYITFEGFQTLLHDQKLGLLESSPVAERVFVGKHGRASVMEVMTANETLVKALDKRRLSRSLVSEYGPLAAYFTDWLWLRARRPMPLHPSFGNKSRQGSDCTWLWSEDGTVNLWGHKPGLGPHSRVSTELETLRGQFCSMKPCIKRDLGNWTHVSAVVWGEQGWKVGSDSVERAHRVRCPLVMPKPLKSRTDTDELHSSTTESNNFTR